jgi:hypothetical protein
MPIIVAVCDDLQCVMHSNDIIAFWVPIAEPPPADHLQLLYPRMISMSQQTYQQERRKQQVLIIADNVVLAATRLGGLRAALQSLHPYNPPIISMALHQDTKVLDGNRSKHDHDRQRFRSLLTNKPSANSSLHLTHCKIGGVPNKKPLTELPARNHHLQAEPKTVFFT